MIIRTKHKRNENDETNVNAKACSFSAIEQEISSSITRSLVSAKVQFDFNIDNYIMFKVQTLLNINVNFAITIFLINTQRLINNNLSAAQ